MSVEQSAKSDASRTGSDMAGRASGRDLNSRRCACPAVRSVRSPDIVYRPAENRTRQRTRVGICPVHGELGAAAEPRGQVQLGTRLVSMRVHGVAHAWTSA